MFSLEEEMETILDTTTDDVVGEFSIDQDGIEDDGETAMECYGNYIRYSCAVETGIALLDRFSTESEEVKKDGFFVKVWRMIKKIFMAVVNGVKNFFKMVWNFITGLFKKKTEKVKGDKVVIEEVKKKWHEKLLNKIGHKKSHESDDHGGVYLIDSAIIDDGLSELSEDIKELNKIAHSINLLFNGASSDPKADYNNCVELYQKVSDNNYIKLMNTATMSERDAEHYLDYVMFSSSLNQHYSDRIKGILNDINSVAKSFDRFTSITENDDSKYKKAIDVTMRNQRQVHSESEAVKLITLLSKRISSTIFKITNVTNIYVKAIARAIEVRAKIQAEIDAKAAAEEGSKRRENATKINSKLNGFI